MKIRKPENGEKGVPSQEDKKETGLGEPQRQASAISHGSPGQAGF